jgi:hypothetical protein
MLWNLITSQAVVTDFERAEIFESRVALGHISPNRKRKRVARDNIGKQANMDVFRWEMNKVRNELRGLIGHGEGLECEQRLISITVGQNKNYNSRKHRSHRNSVAS